MFRRIYQFFKRPERNVFVRAISSVAAGASVLSVLGLWLCVLSVWVSPADFKLAGLMGLSFPVMLAGTVGLFLFSLLFAPRRAWITAVGLIFAWGSISDYLPYHPFQRADAQSDDQLNTFSLINYNTAGMGGSYDAQKGIFAYLQAQHADIVCLQEVPQSPQMMAELKTFSDSSALRHLHATSNPQAALVLLSRYPIVRHERITEIGGNGAWGYWLKRNGGDTLLVVNCHLRSNALTRDERESYAGWVKNAEAQNESEAYRTAHHLGAKIAHASQERALMVDTLCTFLDRHQTMPTVVCGDFNDTPISYTCHRLSQAGLKSAFSTVGKGLGRTFNRDAFVVRIDHAFASPQLVPLTCRVDNSVFFSDHYPLLTRYRLETP
ncbi:endonuclease/exonuclease/phosphatase family protein [Alloprevotella sp. Lung230]|uniref:endonuclease/exonuclease/phosphatase family protein n=1 Tax=Alloprevotella sp. Lung230 TaxID=2766595 RepID=UPI0016565E9D|nr:endonuclease/exonuclease/phosphatase family protein [Alloprevotella sp. Lung230]MBC8626696.1 endonuclease/exonuclease/phosphatase family protein [Alloprevotella sp. Lung230]